MKKFLSLLLSLCLLLGTLPLQVSAFAGDIFPSESTVKTVTLNDGSLSLQNEYIHMTFRKLWGTYAYLTVAPAAKPDEESILIGQTPRCTFTTYDQGREKIEGVVTEPIKAEFVTKTPNGSANAIKVEYSLLAALSLIKAKATVYYELVQLKENGASSDTWGVLASVSEICIDKDSMPQDWNRDFNFKWGYVYLGAMTGVNAGVFDARVWVLVPQIVQTDFRKGGGWDIETKWLGKLPEWDWSTKGVDPLVQAVAAEDSGEAVPMLLAADPYAAENGGTNTQIIEVNANPGETPYILLAFENTVTEQQIKDALTIKKNNQDIAINWVDDGGQRDPNSAINADTDILKNKNDEQEYRMAMLRLSEGGTYEVNTNSLTLVTDKSCGVAITPFESLVLNLNDYQLSGEIKYAETGTEYVLRTYLANAEGGADYLVEEQIVADPENIAVNIPESGTLAPTGEYYVTSFLMTEKETDLDGDGVMEKALAAIDSNQFNSKISYTNTKQPESPAHVNLEAAGNEVMRAAW